MSEQTLGIGLPTLKDWERGVSPEVSQRLAEIFNGGADHHLQARENELRAAAWLLRKEPERFLADLEKLVLDRGPGVGRGQKRFHLKLPQVSLLVVVGGWLMVAQPPAASNQPPRACEQACRAEYYEAYLACVGAARKKSEIAHCNVWYESEVRACTRATCR